MTSIGSRLTREQITRQIDGGGGGMPAFNEALTPDEVTRLVDYLAAMKKQHAFLEAAPLVVVQGVKGWGR